ncbi:MAG: Abi family protein [Stomatobaculum sp.]
MKTPILPSTVEQQIEKLKSQGLIINNESKTAEQLSIYGYSNLIKPYREPYSFINGTSQLEYRTGVTFEQVCSLYLFDKNLRTAIIAIMLDLEEHVKASAAAILAEAFGTKSDDYLEYRKFRNKRKKKLHFTLSHILQTLNNTKLSEKDPIHHCMASHGDVPPWTLFKGVYFSTVVNFIDQFKAPEQLELYSRLFGDSLNLLADQQKIFFMMDSLFVCTEYRNLAAHGARIYNHDSSGNFRWNEIVGPKQTPCPEGLSLLLYILHKFRYATPYNTMVKSLFEEWQRHCDAYPSDVTYLANTLRINIPK